MRCSPTAYPLLLSFLLGACAGTQPPPTTYKPPARPAVVTDATYGQVRRAYERLPVASPERPATRAELAAYLLRDQAERVEADDYEGAVALTVEVTSLCTPTELGRGDLPAELEALARYLARTAPPRGDEARALSANLLLHLLHPEQPQFLQMYEGIRDWGFESRAAIGQPLSRFSEGLIDAWNEHVRMVPTPDTMNMLARLRTEHRAAAEQLIHSTERRMPAPEAFYLNWQQAAIDVAAIYLRHGDSASALTRVEAMGATGQMVDWLQEAGQDDSEAATALVELARRFQRRSSTDVARGICISGLRRFPRDVRFHRCLAQVSAHLSDDEGAIAWYSEAVSMAPDDRLVHDEALRNLAGLIEEGIFSDDPGSTRRISNEATRILEARMARWAGTPPPVPPEVLYRNIALAEMNAGDAKEAEQRLRASLAARATMEGHRQLAVLLERTGRAQEAAEQFRAALALLDEGELRHMDKRAELLERLGDALRLADDPASRLAYGESLALWDDLMARLRNRNISVAQLHRGILLGRLADGPEARKAFGVAMRAAPEMRETYSTILSHLAVVQPDSAFAHAVFRQAVNQLSLDPRWKVYFALWLRLVAGRQGASADEDVVFVLEDLSGGADWPSGLAAFGAGKLDYAQLLERADNLGERTEAHFYEGARLLSVGDRASAAARFQQVIDSQMINFYEYAMAQELLRLPELQPAAKAGALERTTAEAAAAAAE